MRSTYVPSSAEFFEVSGFLRSASCGMPWDATICLVVPRIAAAFIDVFSDDPWIPSLTWGDDVKW